MLCNSRKSSGFFSLKEHLTEMQFRKGSLKFLSYGNYFKNTERYFVSIDLWVLPSRQKDQSISDVSWTSLFEKRKFLVYTDKFS